MKEKAAVQSQLKRHGRKKEWWIGAEVAPPLPAPAGGVPAARDDVEYGDAHGARMPLPLFDLNIEEVLENWEVEHALGELIANALDEQLLSASAPISVVKDETGTWHIVDHGRGLEIQHFTQNGNRRSSTALLA